MKPTWQSTFLAICALMMLGSTVNAAFSFQCPAGGCVGPMVLSFEGSECEGQATYVHRIYDPADYPNIAENVCLSSQSRSRSYTCGDEEYREKLWQGSTDCSGNPTEETLFLTNMCILESMPGSPPRYSMFVCGPNDVNRPVIPPTNALPKPNHPLVPTPEICPNNLCRPDYASYFRFNESTTCDGPRYRKEASTGELSVCYRSGTAPYSYLTICDENTLRRFTYSGSCLDLAIGYTDTFRKPATCAIMDLNRDVSREEIYCPTVSPTFPAPMARPPAPSGHASSLSLHLPLTFILLAIASSFSF